MTTNNTTRASRAAALREAGAVEFSGDVSTFEAQLVPAYRPTVPVRVRDAVYYVGLGVAALVLLAVGVVSIWFPSIAPQVSATGVVVGQAVALVTAGLGVIYRPGRSRSPRRRVAPSRRLPGASHPHQDADSAG